MKKFTADFETTVDPNDCHVWAYSLCEIGNFNNFIYGTSIKEFLDWCANTKENYVLYFHNMKFDIQFIFAEILKEGYTYIKDKKEIADKTFTTLITGMNQYYSCEIYFNKGKGHHVNKVTIYDSQKIINSSVERIAKDFNLPIRKLKIDYKKERKKGYVLTADEIDYIKNDVEIMARALDIMFSYGLDKMTIGSNALHNYKEMNKNFLHYFPLLDYEIDKDMRQSYKGGFTYVNNLYQGVEVGEGIVLDVNSLYPSVMRNEYLPFGEPVFYEGKYQKDDLYNLYIQMFSCRFDIKENKIPTIQLKGNFSFKPTEYIRSSNNDIVTLCLTSVDMHLFFEQYNVSDITFHSGWKFKSIKGIFNNYIDYWTSKKIEAKKEHNDSMYTIAKLMLNSLYGKFATSMEFSSKYPYLDEADGIVKYKQNDTEIKDGVYLPVGTFITAYARLKTITTSQKISDFTREKYGTDLYYYSDTDSIHAGLKSHINKNGEIVLNDTELYDILEIDDFILGYWKIENRFCKAKFLRQKCYIEQDFDGTIKSTVAGLPKDLSYLINFDNFKMGFTTEGMELEKRKLTYSYVRGGVILVDTDFTIQ